MSGKQHHRYFLPQEWTGLAFVRAMAVYERSLKRPDLTERDRVQGALVAYQGQLDALMLVDDVKKAER